MILKKLSILNYKNILQAEVSFSPEINCFFGNNGMGKTNLLDAVHYLSFCKSYINTPDSQLINNGQDMCVLQGNYDYEGREEEIFCAIRRRQRKQTVGAYRSVAISDGFASRFGTDTRRERRTSPLS